MTQKEKLLRTLFNTEGREHLNLKFFRGFSDDISPEDLCGEANHAIFQVEHGIVPTTSEFGDRGRNTVDVSKFSY